VLHRDYLLRLVREATRALARAAAKRLEGDETEARRILDGALVDLLERHASLFRHTTPRTAAGLLGDPDRVVAAARIVAARADLETDPVAAGMGRLRALALYLEARDLGASGDRGLETLAAEVPLDALDERAQALLARFPPAP
jgi:hypothetical protein